MKMPEARAEGKVFGAGAEEAAGSCSRCITCGDIAIPLRVLAVDAERGLALCADESDRRETVEIALVAPVRVGDELLVHAGTAISKLESHRVAANPAGAESGVQEKGPHRRRGQDVRAGAEQPAGVVQ